MTRELERAIIVEKEEEDEVVVGCQIEKAHGGELRPWEMQFL